MNLLLAWDHERPMYAIVMVLVLSWNTEKGTFWHPGWRNCIIRSLAHCSRSTMSDSPISSAEVECSETTFCLSDFHTMGTPPFPSLLAHQHRQHPARVTPLIFVWSVTHVDIHQVFKRQPTPTTPLTVTSVSKPPNPPQSIETEESSLLPDPHP